MKFEKIINMYLSYVNRLVKGLSKRLLQVDRKMYSCIFAATVHRKSGHSIYD